MHGCVPRVVKNRFHPSFANRGGDASYWIAAACAALSLTGSPARGAQLDGSDRNLIGGAYEFLVSGRTQQGALLTIREGVLAGLTLPLSYYDTADYWGAYVCGMESCAVVDRYNAADYTLRPDHGPAGELQTERVNTHNGINLYDAATWQIATLLGSVRGNGEATVEDRYRLTGQLNRMLSTQAADKYAAIRAVTRDDVFTYDGAVIRNPSTAFAFRMIAPDWLATDPLAGTRYSSLIRAEGLPPGNAQYRAGRISWTDWKPITGENAWAFLLGPLHAARLYHREFRKAAFVPFNDVAVQNALTMLPTFAAMQSALGAVYYAPRGTMSNRQDIPVPPHEVAVENNFSLYAGLKLLDATLAQTAAADDGLHGADRERLAEARRLVDIMLSGGAHGRRRTSGLLAFFRNHAWRDGAFVQGGLADDPAQPNAWMPTPHPKAVDVNTWGIAALGPGRVDEWFGFGAAYRVWQQVKDWGGYGRGRELWGVGYSNQDGNGLGPDGAYRQGVLSAEWTAGAINLVRSLARHYRSIPRTSPQYQEAQQFVAGLRTEESSMLEGVLNLRLDRYLAASFPGKPERYAALMPSKLRPYLYASRRYAIPFGWYANPLPSTASTAWMVMVASRYDPFGVDGEPN